MCIYIYIYIYIYILQAKQSNLLVILAWEETQKDPENYNRMKTSWTVFHHWTVSISIIQKAVKPAISMISINLPARNVLWIITRVERPKFPVYLVLKERTLAEGKPPSHVTIAMVGYIYFDVFHFAAAFYTLTVAFSFYYLIPSLEAYLNTHRR